MSSRKRMFTLVVAIGLLVSPCALTSAFAQGNLLNLTQWPTSQGGNDHWYGVYPQKLSYIKCDSAAQALTQDGHVGYVATITSPEENAFIVEQVLANIGSIPDGRIFLGAVVSCGEFTWGTGEPVSFINWQPNDKSRITGSILMLTSGDSSLIGKWHNAAGVTAYALVEFGDQSGNPAGDELINLVQWPTADGGNDHWYAVIGKTMPWSHHVEYAKTLLQDTAHGYLATILSAQENQFIVDHVIAGVTPNAVVDEYYIGGRKEYPTQVAWLTGEPTNYLNWSSSEPTGDGIGIGMWGAASGRIAGTWNDVPSDTVGRDCFHMLWSVVEWGPAQWDSSTTPSGLGNLVQWPISSGGNDHWYGVLHIPLSYEQSKTAVAVLTQNGDTGYLATMNSVQENDFVVGQILNGLGPVPGDQLFLGAKVACGIMKWESTEPVSFVNWQPSEFSRVSGEVTMRAGADPGVIGKWHHSSMSSSFALVEFGSTAEAPPAQEILNLVQWPVSEGGNDHWYAVIAKTMPWTQHVSYAGSLMQDTSHGYLATIRSPQENRFIVDHVIAGLSPNAVTDEYYLGGEIELAHDGVRWLTGESAMYNNWDAGEPNNDAEIGVALWGPNSGHAVGTWNNVPIDTLGIECFHMLWSIVEWGPPDSVTNPTGLIHLVQWPISQGGNDHWYGILANPDTWSNHNAQARLLTQENLPGYLATITSPQENQFIIQSVLGTLGADSLNDTYFLGGKRDCSQFMWVSGETYGYENWEVREQKYVISYIYMHSPLYASHAPGTWNADEYKSLIWRPAIVEFGPLDTYALDSIVNLKQWTVAQGGNDHWYAVINAARPWVSQYEVARSLVHDGSAGYLATITSPDENKFIVDSIMGDLYPNAIIDEYYVGGRRPAKDSAFQWLTGEAIYSGYWASGEPSGDGPAMAIWGKTSGRTIGNWNDVPEDTLGIDCYHQIYAIVEWGGFDPSAYQIALGNVDCDPTNRIDISDLTKLIDFAYVNRSRWNFLWCPEAANIDLDSQHAIDIGDITRIIDYLYISMEPLGGYK